MFTRQHLYEMTLAIHPNSNRDLFVLSCKLRNNFGSLVARDLRRRVRAEKNKGSYKN